MMVESFKKKVNFWLDIIGSIHLNCLQNDQTINRHWYGDQFKILHWKLKQNLVCWKKKVSSYLATHTLILQDITELDKKRDSHTPPPWIIFLHLHSFFTTKNFSKNREILNDFTSFLLSMWKKMLQDKEAIFCLNEFLEEFFFPI